MAVRGWGGSIATAVGVAAGAGAAQLGVGYGLGIIAWPQQASGASESAWVASLAWATWIASTSVVAGAMVADRLGPGAVSTLEGHAGARGTLTNSLWRVALSVAAAIGALITIPLVAVPARIVELASPETIAGGYALVGVVLGLLASIGALLSRAISANVIASVTWLWLLAIVAVIDGVAAGRGLASAQLAVWQFISSGPVVKNIHVWQALLTLGAALLIGALAALPAARRGENAVGVAISGAVGPLLVAASYFLAAPALDDVSTRELSAYLVVPYAVIAGLAGSVVVAGLGPRLDRPRLTAAQAAGVAPPTAAAAVPRQPDGYAAARQSSAEESAVPAEASSGSARGKASVKPGKPPRPAKSS